jgi:exopolyphosphatase/guanosine-5'-triphosphate,3'-diphosphate pyrophosphatase
MKDFAPPLPKDPCPAPAFARAEAFGAAYAALDLGTNNCRLLIASPSQGGFRVMDSFSRVVRLGEGLGSSGLLSEASMDRALAALGACAEKLTRRPLRGFEAVATEACRQASNGGGSTEIAWIRAAAKPGDVPELIGYISLPVGVVTLAERCGAACFTQEGFFAVVDEVAAQLEGFDRLHCIGQELHAGGVQLMGTSGTVTTLAGVVMALPRYRRPLVDGSTLDCEAADVALGDLFAMGRAELAAHPCVGPERVDYVLPGCAIYAAIRRVWPTQTLRVADRGLREGMLLRMMRADREAAGRAPPRRR